VLKCERCSLSISVVALCSLYVVPAACVDSSDGRFLTFIFCVILFCTGSRLIDTKRSASFWYLPIADRWTLEFLACPYISCQNRIRKKEIFNICKEVSVYATKCTPPGISIFQLTHFVQGYIHVLFPEILPTHLQQ
jgi:hypothetical protein